MRRRLFVTTKDKEESSYARSSRLDVRPRRLRRSTQDRHGSGHALLPYSSFLASRNVGATYASETAVKSKTATMGLKSATTADTA